MLHWICSFWGAGQAWPRSKHTGSLLPNTLRGKSPCLGAESATGRPEDLYSGAVSEAFGGVVVLVFGPLQQQSYAMSVCKNANWTGLTLSMPSPWRLFWQGWLNFLYNMSIVFSSFSFMFPWLFNCWTCLDDASAIKYVVFFRPGHPGILICRWHLEGFSRPSFSWIWITTKDAGCWLPVWFATSNEEGLQHMFLWDSFWNDSS